jgi:putative NADH-flavin reductase
MTVLVVGASGATGLLLVRQLLARGFQVKVIVRSLQAYPYFLKDHKNLTATQASLLELSDAELIDQVKGCDAVLSCLGHNLSFKGLFGHPRKLVTEATRRLCEAIQAHRPKTPVKYVLMNTAGNSNRNLEETLPFLHKVIVKLLRVLLPPHRDNENAADYLRTVIGQNNKAIEWVAVRPDSLINQDEVTNYELYPSPTRSAILDPGQTSRINVAHVMAELIADEKMWDTWKGQMPVIYNANTE